MFCKARKILVAGLLSFVTATAMAGPVGYQIIANPDAGVTKVTRSELKSLFLAEKPRWPNGKIVFIVGYASGSKEDTDFGSNVLGMNSVQLRKHYLTKVFNGALSSEPPRGEDAGEVVSLVNKNSGAIGFVPMGTDTGKAAKVTVEE